MCTCMYVCMHTAQVLLSIMHSTTQTGARDEICAYSWPTSCMPHIWDQSGHQEMSLSSVLAVSLLGS